MEQILLTSETWLPGQYRKEAAYTSVGVMLSSQQQGHPSKEFYLSFGEAKKLRDWLNQFELTDAPDPEYHTKGELA